MAPRRNHATFAVCLLGLGTAVGCTAPALKKPFAVPLTPKAGAYATEGRRITLTAPGFIVSAEPLDSAETRAFLKETAGLDADPFHTPGAPGFQVYRVSVANLAQREDLSFHALYATLDAEGRYLYHMPPAEIARELGGFFPEVDLEKTLSRGIYDATTMINPRQYASRLLVFGPLDPKVRALTLAFSNVGVGNATGEVLFPFQVMEEDAYSGGKTPPLKMPANLKIQKD
jgi:hypothetical protein